MNIVFVNSTRKWGGVKTWCINTAAHLSRFGVHSVLFGKDQRFIDRAKEKNIEAYKINFGFDYNPVLIRKFYYFFKRRNINCVIVNIGKDLKSAGIAAKLLNIPVIHRIGSPGDVRSSVENKILHHIIHPSIICCSEFTRVGLIKNLPYLSNFRSAAIHPGVDISSHKIETLNKKYTYITTSQLNKDKRHIDIINAFNILKNKKIDFTLNIVGEGKISHELKQTVSDFGLAEHIHFLGYTNDVIGELRKCDFFILPTQCEPLGIALEEAMANGLVPIARNAGGVPEIWPTFLQDLLLPPESRGPEFANTFENLSSLAPDHVHDLKQRVRHHANAIFSIERQASNILNFINNNQQ